MKNFKDGANYRELVGRKLQRNDPRVILQAISKSFAASSKIEDWSVTNFFEPNAFEKNDKHMMLSYAVDHSDSPKDNIHKLRSMKTQIEDSLEATYKKRPAFTLEYKKNESISKLREAYRSHLLTKKSQSMSIPQGYSPGLPQSLPKPSPLGRFMTDKPKAPTQHSSSSQGQRKSQSDFSIKNVNLEEYNKRIDQQSPTLRSNGMSGQESLPDPDYQEDCYQTDESNMTKHKSLTVSKKRNLGYLLGDSEGLTCGQSYFYPKMKQNSFGIDNREFEVGSEVFGGKSPSGKRIMIRDDPGWSESFCFKRKETHLDGHKKKLAHMSHVNFLANIREVNGDSGCKRNQSQTFDSGIIDTDPGSVNASRIISKYSKDLKYDEY